MLLPLVSTSLGGEPAYPISELQIYSCITRNAYTVFVDPIIAISAFRKFPAELCLGVVATRLCYVRSLANACRVSSRPPSYNSSGRRRWNFAPFSSSFSLAKLSFNSSERGRKFHRLTFFFHPYSSILFRVLYIRILHLPSRSLFSFVPRARTKDIIV